MALYTINGPRSLSGQEKKRMGIFPPSISPHYSIIIIYNFFNFREQKSEIRGQDSLNSCNKDTCA